MRLLVTLPLALILSLPCARAAELNEYEWIATAPIVVVGESLGVHGKFLEVRVLETLRGDAPPGATLKVELRRANRDRSANVDPISFRPEDGVVYAWLLEPSPRRRGKTPAYALVRGVRGARELPDEGRAAVVDALRRFIAIQAAHSDDLAWAAFASMLEERSPLLIQTALAQFLKFRRGEAVLLPSLLPLLDHPVARIREDAGRLVTQILDRRQVEDGPERTTLRDELVARARRDESLEVRIAATEALGTFAPAEVRSVLEQIARDDPEQLVRFAAEKILLGWRQSEAEQAERGAAN